MRHISDREFEAHYLRGLNPQQRAAVTAVEGNTLLLATPGSGKTTVLVTRLGYLLCNRDIPPASILTMTYTRAATRDMRSRFAHLFGEEAAAELQFRTINGVCAKIIQRYCEQFQRSAFTLMDNELSLNAMVRDICQRLNREYPEDGAVRDIRTQITYVKNQMLSAQEISALNTGIEHFPEIYSAYQAELKRRGQMDYDDQMVYALTILRRHPEVLRFVQDRFRYVCVDEAQDSSRIQHALIRLLAAGHGNLFMVGDEDQSIYGFRAACPEALLEFERDHPGARVLLMEENYRSTPEIIQLANRFITENQLRREKTMQATRGSGSPVHVLRCADRREQYLLLLELSRGLETQTAVLYRNNDSALPLIDLLEQNGLPYSLRATDSLTFFTHRVVSDLINILRFAFEPSDGERFLRIYYKFGAGITKKAAKDAIRHCEGSGKPILEELLRLGDLKGYVRDNVRELAEHLVRIREEGAETALHRVWEAMHYGRYVQEKGFDAGKYFILCQLAHGVPSVPALEEKLERLRAAIAGHENRAGNRLILSTIHSSKGLEYDCVYLLDVLDGILPAKTEGELSSEDDEKLYEEERRLFYVGMTRAKNDLYLFNCNAASSFMAEVCGALPVPDLSEGDLFGFLRVPQIGKRYCDREWGVGTVTAQCDEWFYLRFEDGRVRKLTLEEMVKRRDRRMTLLPAAALRVRKSGPQESDRRALRAMEHIGVGTTLKHRTFGAGVVRELRGDIVTIAFQSGGMKRFVLRDSLSRGLLYL